MSYTGGCGSIPVSWPEGLFIGEEYHFLPGKNMSETVGDFDLDFPGFFRWSSFKIKQPENRTGDGLEKPLSDRHKAAGYSLGKLSLPLQFSQQSYRSGFKSCRPTIYKPLRRPCPCPNFISGPAAITLQDVSGHSKAGALCVVLPVYLSL